MWKLPISLFFWHEKALQIWQHSTSF